MINSIVAYDLEKVKKEMILSKAKSWKKSGLLTEEQWLIIKKEYVTNLFTPKFIMRILIFIASYIGLSMLSGIGALMFNELGEVGIRVVCAFVGFIIVFFAEQMIKNENHFRSGLVEAGTYAGAGFIFFSVFDWDATFVWGYYAIALLFCVVFSIRYLNRSTILGGLFCVLILVFEVFSSVQFLIPFAEMAVLLCLFLGMQSWKKKIDPVIWEDHIILFESTVLILLYFSLNYFVVRQLSVELMGVDIEEGGDIPFAFLFYGWTILVPISYLYYGLKTKSLLFIRVSLLTLAIAVFTFKFYFSLGHPEVSITIAGAILIIISIVLFRYLKVDRNGFTRKELLKDKWGNSDVTAFVVSQTLGGHQLKEGNEFSPKGGEFGGGGASGSF